MKNVLRKTAVAILRLLTSMVIKSLRAMGKSGDSVVHELLCIIERDLDCFITFHFRPKKSDDILIRPLEVPSLESWAIVMQGPIWHEEDFTYETLKLYKRYFPTAAIIYSTWTSEDRDTLDIIRDIGIELVLTDLPENPGYGNVNLQIISSGNGMKRAKKLGVQYAMKTRADQRIYAPNVDVFLKDILEMYPVTPGYKQINRIIGISFDTLVYRMYGLTDLLLFGQIDDMLRFWNPPLDTRLISSEAVTRPDISLRELAEFRVSELYLVTEYLQSIGRKLKWTLENS